MPKNGIILEKWAHFRQMRASAGSGKTYRLTQDFLKLLAGVGEPDEVNPSTGKRIEPNWQEIIATTFTNAAAAEMRSRIIANLKDMALGREIPAELAKYCWTKEKARRRVDSILQNLGALNVRTIDSLLHLVVRLSALELHLRPDFKPSFQDTEPLMPFLNGLFIRTRQGYPNYDANFVSIVRNVCHNTLESSDSRGFLAGDHLRKNICNDLFALREFGDCHFATQEQIVALLDQRYAELCAAASTMQNFLKQEELHDNGNSLNNVCQKLVDLKERHDLTGQWDTLQKVLSKTPESLKKQSLQECLNKKSKPASADAAAAYKKLASMISRGNELALLSNARSVLPFFHAAQNIETAMDEFLQNAEEIPSEFILHFAKNLLESHTGVSDALCRLGSSLRHFLVDEFQDTSSDQWTALKPLVIEALANHGSFTWVGDIKQSIYGWRKGDASLFDKISHEAELVSIVGEPAVDNLPENWRSCRRIVEINNTIFTPLADEKHARAILKAILPKTILIDQSQLAESILDKQVPLLQKAFDNAGQKLSVKQQHMPEGYVSLKGISGTAEELTESMHMEFLNLFRSNLEKRRKWRDIAILVRSHNEASKVAEWLMQENIPVITENSFLLAEHPLIAQFVALLAFINDPHNNQAMLALLSGTLFTAMPGFSALAIQDWLVSREKQQDESLCDAFRKDFPDIWEQYLQPFSADMGLLTSYDAIREAIRYLHVWQRFPNEKHFVQRFLELLYLAEEQGAGSFSAFLNIWETRGDAEIAPLPENLDAVHIMTIHKAKGLEFPVVIVPWGRITGKAAWGQLMPARVDNLQMPVRCTKDLSEAYYKSMLDNGRESIHLSYVAWTRAAEELYVFFNHKEKSPINILLQPLWNEMQDTVYESGSLPPKLAKPDAEVDLVPEPAASMPAVDARQLMNWLPKLRIFRQPLPAELSLQGNRRGLFVHHCLTLLRLPSLDTNPQKAAEEAIRLGMQTFLFPVRSEEIAAQNIPDLLAWYAAQPNTREWLLHGRPEQELADEDGRMRRVDLFVQHDDRITIIEYKTGEMKESYFLQISNYIHILRKIKPNCTVSGALVYLDQKTILPVS